MYRPPPGNIKETEFYKILTKHNLSYAEAGRIVGYSRDYISLLVQKKRPFTKKFLLSVLDNFFYCHNKNRKK